MNIPLLRRIQRQIDKAPERFFMSATNRNTACGTAYCIAGWACALSGINLKRPMDGLEEAQTLLKLDFNQTYRLFNFDEWPSQYRGAFLVNDPEVAALAIARIEHFVATEGRE